MVNNIIVILILSLLSFLTIISLTNYIFAQYSIGEQPGAATLEEQLKLAQEKLKVQEPVREPTSLEEQLKLAQEKLNQLGLGSLTDSNSQSLDKQAKSVQQKKNQIYQDINPNQTKAMPQILVEWKIPTPISSNNFLDYENSHVGYKIKYPDNE